jgi:hypothetical protein
MGIFQDILPGVTKLKLEDSNKRKQNLSTTDSNKIDKSKIKNLEKDK